MRKRSRKIKRIENRVGGKFDSIVERYDAAPLMENTKYFIENYPHIFKDKVQIKMYQDHGWVGSQKYEKPINVVDETLDWRDHIIVIQGNNLNLEN